MIISLWGFFFKYWNLGSAISESKNNENMAVPMLNISDNHLFEKQ